MAEAKDIALERPIANSGLACEDPYFSAAKQGSEHAFCQLVQPIEDRLLKQSYLLCKSSSIAEDLAQEALIASWRSLHKFDGNCRLFTWVYGILIRIYKKKSTEWYKKPLSFFGLLPEQEINPGEIPRESRWQFTSHQSPLMQILKEESHSEIREAIESLSDHHKEVLLLRYFGDASLEDISRVTGSSLGTVKSRLHYALEKLKQYNFKTLK